MDKFFTNRCDNSLSGLVTHYVVCFISAAQPMYFLRSPGFLDCKDVWSVSGYGIYQVLAFERI